MAGYTTAFLGASQNSDWWTVIPKYLVIAVLAWAGLDVDIEPTVTFVNLWCLDLVAFAIKEIVRYRRFPIETIVFKGLRHIAVLFIPLALTMVAKSNGRPFEVLYTILMFAACIYLLVAIISSVATMFTKREYENDEAIGLALESLRKKLLRVFKRFS